MFVKQFQFLTEKFFWVMAGIEIPHPGDDPLKNLHETGQRLEEFAKKWGVPFEYHALAGSNWESFTAKDFDLRKEEVLAVSTFKMHHISDEGVLGASPRELLLRRIRSLNPKVRTSLQTMIVYSIYYTAHVCFVTYAFISTWEQGHQSCDHRTLYIRLCLQCSYKTVTCMFRFTPDLLNPLNVHRTVSSSQF